MTDGLSPFQRGVAFMLHFRDRAWTIQDLADWYKCDYRAAMRMKWQLERLVKLEPAGYAEKKSYITGPCREKYRIAV